MTEPMVAVVGLGLVGGSLARALVAAGHRVRGTTTDRDDARAAKAAGIDAAAGGESVAAVVSGAEVVILATPVDTIARVARDVMARALPSTLVLHVGGLQSPHALGLSDDVARRLIGTHPLAGTHESGFAASRADLFQGATVSADGRASSGERRRIEELWSRAGAARVVYRAAEEHDALMAWVSHLPQLVSSVLAATLASRGIGSGDAGTGLRDSTRLAASPYALWRPILAAAPDEIVAALRAVETRLAAARGAIEGREWGELERLWQGASTWRTRLERDR